MIGELEIIFFVILFAIGSIIGVAYILQKVLVDRRFSTGKIQSREKNHYPEFREKMHSNSGMKLPTFEIDTLLSVPDTEDVIVLLKNKTTSQNLLRCRSDGSVVWVAQLPKESKDIFRRDDAYERVERNGQKLRAITSLSFLVMVDIETGQVLSSEFLK